jgi:hypothetical protein
MKTMQLLTALLGMAVLANAGVAQERPKGPLAKRANAAEKPAVATGDGPQARPGGGERCRPPGPPILTPEERQKLRAAHEQALKDPAVKEAKEELEAARKKFRELMRAELIEIDPSVEAIIEKLQAARKAHPGHGPGRPWHRGPGAGPDDDAAAADIE